MDMTFQDMRDFTVVYMDDIVVFSSTWLEHLANIQAVLTRLRENEFFVKRSECERPSDKIDFVGFRISASGVQTQPEKIAALAKWPIPKDVADFRIFMGCTNFYLKRSCRTMLT